MLIEPTEEYTYFRPGELFFLLSHTNPQWIDLRFGKQPDDTSSAAQTALTKGSPCTIRSSMIWWKRAKSVASATGWRSPGARSVSPTSRSRANQRILRSRREKGRQPRRSAGACTLSQSPRWIFPHPGRRQAARRTQAREQSRGLCGPSGVGGIDTRAGRRYAQQPSHATGDRTARRDAQLAVQPGFRVGRRRRPGRPAGTLPTGSGTSGAGALPLRHPHCLKLVGASRGKTR